MKVLQINRLGATLSTGRTTRELHDYLTAHGHESYLACPMHEDCEDNFAFSSWRELHLNTARFLINGRDTLNLHSPTRRLLRYIDELKPDVVHLRVLHTGGIHFGMLLKHLAKRDIPTVITLHDFWYMTGGCPFYTLLGCDKWTTGCGDCPYHAKRARKPLLDRSARMWRDKKAWFSAIPRLAVIGVSDWVTEEARRSFLGNARIVRRIYNWIDLETFAPHDVSEKRRALAPDGTYIILGVASGWRMGDRKGLDTYLALADIMPEHYRIVLVGGGSPDLPLPPNVTLLPRSNSTAELADYYAMADVYLNLSAEETFGKVSAEAVACGTPVVAYDSTANREIVPPQAGALVQRLDAEEILERLRELEQQPKSVYTPICRAFAQQHFDKATNIEQYLALYRELTE